VETGCIPIKDRRGDTGTEMLPEGMHGALRGCMDRVWEGDGEEERKGAGVL
jgi:hypothetical protein